jgi:hypothetical protein
MLAEEEKEEEEEEEKKKTHNAKITLLSGKRNKKRGREQPDRKFAALNTSKL